MTDHENCPTCGQPVEVITGDESTSHYVPAKDECNCESCSFARVISARRPQDDRGEGSADA